ncbi:hypothetical protein RHGRI_017979 [Rhododendron griersonianum]|uniref:3-oxoacyl-[acyl-carrier-protein] synthase, mitochondrial n=1 Tax=Rhododendron griersonianum TaxID=479676 RepID=A0AAV6JZS0_9ERIC|nr:hypothetical protein RHGRI_017979 [Rhododendron griersonianum]
MAVLSRSRSLLSSRFHFTRFSSSSSSTNVSFGPPPSVPSRRVVVTGLGMVTPLGCGVEATWKRLIVGECGVRSITPEDLKMSEFDKETRLHTYDQLTSKVAATVPCGTNSDQFNEEIWLNSKEDRSISRFVGYALCAANEALRDANWMPTEEEEKEQTGVSIGGGIGSISDILDASKLICEKRVRRLSPFFIPRILINMAAGHVSIKYGFQGPNHAAVTACATGGHAIGDATRMIQFGDADVMVAGGTESSIDALSIAGFCKSRALSTKYNSTPEQASRPFDCGRDGFVIGEGAGVMVLEELKHAEKRGAKIYAEVRGYGTSGDAYHITQPNVNGIGAILAMTRALKQSGLHPNQVDYLNAHATSTPLGDAIEGQAIKSVFLEHATLGALAFSSTKGATGHLLGAAGAVEAIFAVLSIDRRVAPLTLNLIKPDPIFSNHFMPLSASKWMPVRAAMSNSFGFGGTNASLVFSAF